jgi:hypothetical protein
VAQHPENCVYLTLSHQYQALIVSALRAALARALTALAELYHRERESSRVRVLIQCQMMRNCDDSVSGYRESISIFRSLSRLESVGYFSPKVPSQVSAAGHGIDQEKV